MLPGWPLGAMALIGAEFVRMRHSIDMTSHGDHHAGLIERGPAAWLDRRDRHRL
jgi:hypothetical protein